MATFTLASILVHTTPGGDFANNDVVTVLWNDSTNAIELEKNGSAFSATGASQIGELNTNYYVSGITSYEGEYAISGYSFCNSTTLNWFRMATFYPMPPFMEWKQTANSPVCDVGGGVVCDIQFSGPVIATNTTSLTTPVGTITASATSSNGTVKYGLTDFDYATGGQTSGSFTGLGTGRYTVYAKDENGCTTQTQVFVFYSPAEQEHYRFTWASLQIGQGTSRDARVRIYEREYVGSLVEIDYGDVSPFKLNKPKQGDLNDKFYPVHPTNATLILKSQYDYQFLPLFTQDNKKYRVVYEVDEGSGFTEIWQGFIVPSTYREDFIAAPYSVEILIADNVKTLEQEPFTDANGNLLFGSMKLIKVISHIMKKTGLSLKIRSGINIFEANHNTADTDDPFDQTYVDVTCYREEDEPFNCWKVLESILRPFGARIFQYDNQWIIEEIDRATAEYAYRVFDVDGDYESNSTFDPIIDIKAPSLTNRAALVDRDHSFEVVPAYGKITLTSKLNYIGSIVSGGFERKDLLSPESETFVTSQGVYKSEEGFRDWTYRHNGTSGGNFGRVIVSNRGDSSRSVQDNDPTRSVGAFFYNPDSWSGNLRNAYIESSVKDYQYGPGSELRFSMEYSAPAPPGYEFIVLKFMIKVGSDYLQPDLTWDTTESIFRAYPSPSSTLQNFEITVPAPDVDVITDSNVQVRIYFYAADFYDWGTPDFTLDGDDGVDDLKDATNGFNADDLPRGVDYRTDIFHEGTFGLITEHFRGFYELRASTAAEDITGGIIRPKDFDSNNVPFVLYQLKRIPVSEDIFNRRRGNGLKFYVDNVSLDSLLNGQPPPEEDVLTLPISDFINEYYEVELFNFDLPDIVNGKNMYNNYFRLSDGTPTALWTRTDIAESLSLQEILLKVLGANHSAPTFRMTGSFVNEFSRIGINNYIRLTKAGSDLTMQNTEFTSNLNNWTGDSAGQAFAWTSDNSGSAEATLSGAEDSEKRYQSISHSGGYVTITVNVHVEADATNDREDVLWLLFYRDSAIIHTEKMQTFAAPQSAEDYDFTYKAFVPEHVNRIGFYIKRVSGTGDCTYQIGQFEPEGTDVQEVYQIADYQSEERLNRYFFELIQLSKGYISLAGVDTGGNNQSGGTTGREHSSAYSSAYS